MHTVKRWLPCCVALAVMAANCGSFATATKITINALQWNPHWECFVKSDECKFQVLDLLSTRLTSGTDFANVVMLETNEFVMPTGWNNISHVCHRDVVNLFFDATRWRVIGPQSGESGCMVENDRPYVVQAFQHQTEDLKFIVVGAHFPHATFGTALKKSIDAVKYATGLDSVMLIADTNLNRPGNWPSCPKIYCQSSAEVFQALGLERGKTIATDLFPTCCLPTPIDIFGYIYQMDRVISNFGTGMTSELHDDPAPSWAVGAFHKAVTGRFTVDLSSNATMDLSIDDKGDDEDAASPAPSPTVLYML